LCTLQSGSKGKRLASTNDTSASSSNSNIEKYARTCQKWGVETCLHALMTRNTDITINHSREALLRLSTLEVILHKAGVSSIDKDNELLLQLQQTLHCAAIAAKSNDESVSYIDTVMKLRNVLSQGLTQH
jgi:hypothetical protein